MKTQLAFAHLLGLLVAMGFPPFGIWPLTWFACAAMAWVFLKSRDLKEAKRLAWSFFHFYFAVTLYGFYWVVYTLHEFGGMPWIVAGIAFLIGAALLSFVPFLIGYFWPRFYRLVASRLFPQGRGDSLVLSAFALAIWLAFFEWVDIRPFPWTWAQSVGSDTYLLASVGVLDTWGWSLLFLVFVVGMGLWAFNQKRFSSKFALLALGVFVLFFAPLYGVGAWKKSQLEAQYSERQPVALLQGNVGNYQKKLSKLQIAPTVRNVLAIHRDLIEEVAIYFQQSKEQGAEYAQKEPWIIWPETSFPGFPMQKVSAAEALGSFVELTGGLHIVGAYEDGMIDFHGRQKQVDYNVAALFHAREGYVQHYRKRIRVPFGEYVPLDNYFSKAYDWFPAVNHFGVGEDFTSLAHPDKAGPVFVPVICYEILFSSFVDQFLAQAEADYPGRPKIIVNLTNDSWYGPTSEPWLHSLLSRWAASRVSKPLLRPTNTGLSQIVAPWGEVLFTGPRDEGWVVMGELPVEQAVR